MISTASRCALAAAAALLVAAIPAAAQADDDRAERTANYLAGLAVPAIPADQISTAENPWIVHATELQQAWKHTDKAQLAAIAHWAPGMLGPAYTDTGTMFYMFSGPDFLYAHAFFPYARTYILCGNEPVGAIPNLDAIPPQALPGALANLRKSLGSLLSWSFFITKNMKTDLNQPQLQGTLPLLYVFLSRTGCTIASVELVAIDRNGRFVDPGAKGSTPGARIVFHNPTNPQPSTSGSSLDLSVSSQPSTLYYFCSDLSDDGIKANPGFMRFCEQQGHGNSLLKAASYLMHEPGFSEVRQFLLSHSDTIVQDDSGIPLRYFEPGMWQFRYCGLYVGPIKVFEKYWQPDLANAYARSAPAPLPFGFGYQWQPHRSGLMIVTRKPSANTVAAHSEQRHDEPTFLEPER